MQCPKCNYVRKAYENVPDWQCPSCGVAYVKVLEAQRTSQVKKAVLSEQTGFDSEHPYGIHLLLSVARVILGILVILPGLFGLFGVNPGGGSVSVGERLALAPLLVYALLAFVPTRRLKNDLLEKRYIVLSSLSAIPCLVYILINESHYGEKGFFSFLRILFVFAVFASAPASAILSRKLRKREENGTLG